MHAERTKWRTVSGGSRQYVDAVCKELGNRLRLGTPVHQISPFGERVRVSSETETQIYDEVILATHSDVSQKLLAPAFEDQRFLLASARYRPNRIYLHKDP